MKAWMTILFLAIVLSSCTKDQAEVLPYPTTPYVLLVPKKFPAPILSAENPMTEEGILLGRYLYYDTILSSNNRSCAGCHMPDHSFSSPLFISRSGEIKSVPPHINLAWNPDYCWNGSEPVLDRLCLGDFSPEFFNTNMTELPKKLKSHAPYAELFRKAFNVQDLTKLSSDELQLKIVYAISQFIRTLVSSDSKFDKWIRHEVMLNEEEMTGYELFSTERGDCFHCHNYPLMTSNTFNNNGLDSVHQGSDLGRYLVTGLESDKGKFSAPTLRNIALTAPYMHDGRFKTLEEVVDFYDSGVHLNSENVDPIMTKPLKKYGLSLSPYQKNCLVQFLKTLTDTAFLCNKAYKKPF